MRKTILIVSNILVLFLLSGCFSNIDTTERNHAEKAEKEAVPIIHNHFKSKYGIEVEIKSVLAKFSGCSHDTDRCYTGLIRAVVSYNGKTFPVDVENQIVYDNYQAEEIEQACLTYALEKLDLSQPVFYKILPRYRGHAYYDFGSLLVNDYFDGTNTEKIFDMISPSFMLFYENGAVFDSNVPDKLTALFENTTDDKQSMEFIVLEKDSAEKVSQVRWYEDTVKYYAPYVEYSVKYRKNENMEPEIFHYLLEPLSDDLPILKEFLVLGSKYGSNNFVIRQEEPPKGWNIERGFEQIIPSCHLLWNEDERDSKRIFIPSLVWMELCKTYDEIYLVEYREYANGETKYKKCAMNPNDADHPSLALYGDFFCFSVDTSTAYLTILGIRK